MEQRANTTTWRRTGRRDVSCVSRYLNTTVLIYSWQIGASPRLDWESDVLEIGILLLRLADKLLLLVLLALASCVATSLLSTSSCCCNSWRSRSVSRNSDVTDSRCALYPALSSAIILSRSTRGSGIGRFCNKPPRSKSSAVELWFSYQSPVRYSA